MSLDNNINLLQFGALTARGAQGTGQVQQVQPQKVQQGVPTTLPTVQPGLLETQDYETAQAVIDSGIDFEALAQEEAAKQEEKLGFDFSNLIDFQKDDGEIHPFNEKNLFVA